MSQNNMYVIGQNFKLLYRLLYRLSVSNPLDFVYHFVLNGCLLET